MTVLMMIAALVSVAVDLTAQMATCCWRVLQFIGRAMSQAAG